VALTARGGNAVQFWYVGALALSAVTLLGMAVTRFGTDSVVDRILCAAGAVGIGWYAYHLAFRYEGGAYMLYWAPFVIPIYAGYRLVRGFLNRAADREKRAASAVAAAEAKEWTSTRRW
jgi:hypothetical protein